jgi:hypothetical protein
MSSLLSAAFRQLPNRQFNDREVLMALESCLDPGQLPVSNCGFSRSSAALIVVSQRSAWPDSPSVRTVPKSLASAF